MIIFECSENIQEYDEFSCNITLTLSPPAGTTNHQVTVTINTTPPIVINKVFSSNFTQISTTINTNGTYTATVSESNYNAQIRTDIIVAESNIFKSLSLFVSKKLNIFLIQSIQEILIQLNCPQKIYALQRFTCNVIMLQNPATGHTTHEVRVTIGTSPAIVINEVFSTNTKEISTVVETNGTYDVTVYERNYDTFIRTPITVIGSNKSKINKTKMKKYNINYFY